MIDFLSNHNAPWLLDANLMRWSLQCAWALVLGAATSTVSRRLVNPWRWSLTVAVMAWTLWSGTMSPAHLLGLAFQSPSWTSVVLCWMVLLRDWKRQGKTDFSSDAPANQVGLVLAIVVMGWALLLDTLAVWPVSVYAWGFGFAAFASAALAVLLMWMVNGTPLVYLAALILALYGLTRLPTGNVWDALLDPWLWIILHVRWLINGVRGWFRE